MSVREELHNLVDQLEDECTLEALESLRRLVRGEHALEESSISRLNRRMGPSMVSGQEFFNTYRQSKDLAMLAEEQGVKPVERFEDLLGDFWPEDETAEEFDAWLREIRGQDGHV